MRQTTKHDGGSIKLCSCFSTNGSGALHEVHGPQNASLWLKLDTWTQLGV